MTKFNIENTNEYKKLLGNQTVARLVGNRISRQNIDNYFNWVKEKYPTATGLLDSSLKLKEQDLNEAINSQQVNLVKGLMFDILEASEIRSQARQKLNQLFAQSMPLDFQKVDKKEIESLKIDNRVFYDTSDVIFLVNGLIEEVFFGLVPRELEKELNQEPKINLNELPAEWNTKRDELLSTICTEVIGRGLPYLESTEKMINEKYQELVTIIQKARVGKLENSKEPVCNKPQHQQIEAENNKLKQEKAELEQLKNAIHVTLDRVYNRWNKATIIERGKENEVLGDKWAERLQEKKSISEVNEKEAELIKKINDEEKKEQGNQKKYEEEIQVEIDRAQNFIDNFDLSVSDANSLLEKIRTFRDEWGASSNPAKWHAFLNKNQENTLNKLIAELRVKIRSEEAVQLVTQFLNQAPILRPFELGSEYTNFAARLRKMNSENEINEYENQSFVLGTSLRPVRTRLNSLIESADNSQKAQENTLYLLLELEKFRNSSAETDKLTWLAFTNRRTKVNALVSNLLRLAREQALNRLTHLNSFLKADQTTLDNYRQKINWANSQELQSQKYENEFLTKVLENQQQTQIVDNPPPKT